MVKTIKNNKLKQLIVSKLPKEYLKHIPIELLDKEVSLVKSNRLTKESSREIYDILNFRFVYNQLGIILQGTKFRQVWYSMEKRLKRKNLNIDFSGDSDKQYLTCLKTIKRYCESLMDFYNLNYWGLTMDEIGLSSKGRGIIYDINMNATLLDITCLIDFNIPDKRFNDEFLKTPFFLLICEKEDTLLSMMSDLKNRGFKGGFYGIITQGYSSTNVIRLLMELSLVSNFHVFVVHDFDLDGISIFFDIKRTFNNAVSVGINNEMLNLCGIDFEDINQEYKKGVANKTQISRANTLCNELFLYEIIDNKVRIKYQQWIKTITPKKAELDSLLALSQERDLFINKAHWITDYLITILETKTFNLNRYKKQNYDEPYVFDIDIGKPSFINDIISEIQENAIKSIQTYLENKNLKFNFEWKELIENDFNKSDMALRQLKKIYNWKGRNKAIFFRRQNRNYLKSLTKIEQILSNQFSEIYSIKYDVKTTLNKIKNKMIKTLKTKIRRTPEYNEVKEKLESLKETIIDSLDNL